MIEVRANDYDLVGASGRTQMTFGSFEPFTAVRKGAGRHNQLRQTLFQCRFALLVIALVFPQSGFDDGARTGVYRTGSCQVCRLPGNSATEWSQESTISPQENTVLAQNSVDARRSLVPQMHMR